MSVPIGSAVSSSTDEPRPEPQLTEDHPLGSSRPRSNYLFDLALRREADKIRQQTVYGLVMGWVLTLVGGFLFFCVPSRVDWLWCGLMSLGVVHLAVAVVVPQFLAWPERAWMTVARWQGWLVMTVMLTIVYFGLIWPAGFFSRRRTRGFVEWHDQPPLAATSWEPIDVAGPTGMAGASSHRRSLPLLLVSVIGFFIRRGNYVVVPIIILLLVLGLMLYFVQSSALAPFIYTLF